MNALHRGAFGVPGVLVCQHQEITAHPTAARVAEVLLDGCSIAGRARVLQAAADGRWEAATSVAVPAAASSARALVREAGGADADVAVELEWLGRPLVFVGARRAGDPEAFEADVAALADGSADDPLAALTVLAGGSPEELDHAELGAANAWRSVGPLRLWTSGEVPGPLDLEARLAEHPALARCTAPVAVELSFRRPRECWIGVEVSAPSGGHHVVRPAAVEALLRRLLTEA